MFIAQSNESEDIAFLTHALKDYEGSISPDCPQSIKGCTFLKGGLCELHSLKLKPLQERTSIHHLDDKKLDTIAKTQLDTIAKTQNDSVKEHIMQDWKSEEGQALINSWCKEYNIKSKEKVFDSVRFMTEYLTYHANKDKNDC